MQLANNQLLHNLSSFYANITCTSSISNLSNLLLKMSEAVTSSLMTDIFYCTINTSRVEEENEKKT